MRDATLSLIVAGSLALAAGAPRPGTVAPAPPTATIPFVFDDGRVFIPVRLAHDSTRMVHPRYRRPRNDGRRRTGRKARSHGDGRRHGHRCRLTPDARRACRRDRGIRRRDLAVAALHLRRPARFTALSVLGYPRTRRDRRTVLRRACRGAGLRHTHDAGLRTVHVHVPRPGCHPAAHVHGHRAGCHRHTHATKRCSQAHAAPRRPRCQGEPSRYRAVHPCQRDPRCVSTAHADGTRVRGRRRDPLRLRPRPLTRTRPARGRGDARLRRRSLRRRHAAIGPVRRPARRRVLQPAPR